MLAAESEESEQDDYNVEEEKEKEAAEFRMKISINKASSLTDLTAITSREGGNELLPFYVAVL